VLSAGASIIGASNASDAAQQAGEQQAAAARYAADLQHQQFEETQANLQPFIGGGKSALTALQTLTGTGEGGNPLTAALTRQFQPTMEELAKTPGYQFALEQGTQAAQNSYAAKGLGTSGAAIKGGVNYATGLASTTYQQQFENFLKGNMQTYNMVAPQVQTGANAAANLGTIGQQSVANQGNLLTSGAAAQAAGTVGAANALTAGMTGVSNAVNQTAILEAMNQGGLFKTPGSQTPATLPANPAGNSGVGTDR
jgi:hypothetical protein